ncbi:alpha/beta hydrolase [Cupriavidus sp. SW-Y-13]|uniref:alpha/beta hydrolase n=1 Tax=Cupriavidus sp. SW-Y-13 TaxID=2653854 RepID=UPI001365219F|nr:alpha/beta hydrolase [Cupriavidus sp. SW-Y-13]MWL86907.1 alpha/beta hydrolase fold domain-containing protein [Cupriavidus sp. SW-Y-13]
MPLHPDLDAFLEMANLASQSRRPMSEMTPDEARATYDASTLALDAPGAEIPVEALHIPARDGHALPARLYRGSDTAAPAPVLLYFHGGGYVVGGLDSHDSLCRDLADAAQCAVLSIDYRLAPEHKFPTAFHDAEDACAWLRANAASLGLDPERIAIGGDSAGGTLATALCIAARHAGTPQPRLQVLLYPCTSAHQDTASHARLAVGYLLEQRTLQWMFGHYLRHADDRADWRFAPLEATDLGGLAPALIVLAEFDPLVDEGHAYARRLQAAGVTAQTVVWPGVVHDFARLGNVVDEAARMRAQVGRAIAEAFHHREPSTPS